ncbi:MAG: hypothetical protein CMG59_02985, partial [Candidatus Marinimicrobia bacterium]|nr:hypothetical protein [Candidatus Neomarinimicrobiota bacterium]
MFKRNSIILFSMMTFLLPQNIISISSNSIQAFETTTLNLNLENSENIYGFQMDVQVRPNYGYLDDTVYPTPRSEHMTISANMQGNGILRIVGFSLSQVPITAGDGPILNIDFSSTSPYNSEVEISIVESQTILSDINANEINYSTYPGLISILGDNPPDIFPPNLLSAQGNYQNISLIWEHPAPNDILGYNIYRDGAFHDQTTMLDFVDESLPDGLEFCYQISAYNEFSESALSNQLCASTVILLDPPVGVIAAGNNENQNIEVNWSAPGSAMSYSVVCDGGSYPYEVSWELINQDSEVLLAGGAPFNQENVSLLFGNYTLIMQDSYGDGWNGNLWEIYNQQGLLVTSCTLDFNYDYGGGSYGVCEFSLGSDNRLGVESAEFNDIHSIEKSNINQNNTNLYFIDNTQPHYDNANRNLLGYKLYRNSELLTELDNDTFSYTDSDTENNQEYCYFLRSEYSQGISVNSNESCSEWILLSPENLTAIGENGGINLSWTAPNSVHNVLRYDIFRDEIFLNSTTDLNYFDNSATYNQNYCYSVTAIYSMGSSDISNLSCSEWRIIGPSSLSATGLDSHIRLEWTPPSSNLCADEIIPSLPFSSVGNIVGNEDNWLVQGSQGSDYSYLLTLNNPTTIDIELCSSLTDYDAKLEIFTANQDCEESTTGFYNDDGSNCPESPATYTPSELIGVSLSAGQYYIVVDGYGGATGSYEIFVSESNLTRDSQLNVEYSMAYESRKSGINYNSSNWSIATSNNNENYNSMRDLLGFDIYRNGDLIATVASDIFSYDDFEVVNLEQYCYNIIAQYNEGSSEFLPQDVCATPIPGLAPTELFTIGESGSIFLNWEGDASEYRIYRDGEFLATTSENNYEDSSATNDVEYCYRVTSVYQSGESDFSNESCSSWILNPPVGLSTSPSNGAIRLQWSPPGSSMSYSIDCDGGSWQSEIAWELVNSSSEVVLAGGSPFSEQNIQLLYGNYTLNMTDSYGDGWNGNIWNIYDQNSNLVNSCTLNEGFDGSCEINLTSDPQSYQSSAIEAIDNSSTNKLSGNINENYYYANNSSQYILSNLNINRDLLQYEIYRDGVQIVTLDSDSNFYLDTGLENGTQYCYYIIAVYDEGNSLPSSTICNAPDAGPMCPPENLFASSVIGDTSINVSWDAPNPSCQDQLRDRLNGYNLYRDDVLLTSLGIQETSFSDTDVSFDLEYCYKIKANYDQGESNPSNENCATLVNPENISVLDVGSVSTTSQTDFELDISVQNQFPVAGFQFTLIDNPDLFEVVSVSTTPRTDGFTLQAQEQLDGSVIIVGFSITGGTIDIGEGSILSLACRTYQTLETQVSNIEVAEFYLGDSNGQDLLATYNAGQIIVTPQGASILSAEILDCNPNCIQIGDYDSIEINLENEVPVAGLQFNLILDNNILDYVSVTPTERTNGFNVSGQLNGSMLTVLCFSLTGETIDIGTGPVIEIEFEAIGPGIADLDFSNVILSSIDAVSLPVVPESGYVSILDGPPSGCTDVNACNYDSGAESDDGSCEYIIDCLGECGGTSELDCNGDCNGEAQLDVCGVCGGMQSNPQLCLQYFVDIPESTGINALIIIQSATGLEVGDEVGLFDTSAILNSGDCETDTGELLIGSGVWTGEQLEIVGVGSVDNCAFGGFQLPGYREGNEITYKVWKASDNMVYPAEAEYTAGTGSWGELLTAVSNIQPIFTLTQSIELRPFQMNDISFNLIPDNTSTNSIFNDVDILIASDDSGLFYVPGFNVDNINNISNNEGYSIFPNGSLVQILDINGLPSDLGPILCSAFQNNAMPYLPQECMPTDGVFAGYEDQLLVVQDDAGGFYVPSFGVMSLTEMCPGEGYSVFLNGADGISFTYPDGGMARTSASLSWESYNEASTSR